MRGARWSLDPVAMVVAAALASAGPAAASGYCGADPTGATACPVTSNGTFSGSIASEAEQDYYVFYAAHQTDLRLTVTDSEDARCSNDYPYYPYICGWIDADLLDGRGNQIAHTAISDPNNGVTGPQSVTKTIGPGVYYIDVTGYAGSGTLPAVPYGLTVDGNPGVQWPPACIVPRLSTHTSLARAKHLVRGHRCTVGAVRHVRSRSTPVGDVVRLSPRPHTILAYGAPVAIYVSAPPTRGHRRRRHRRG